MMKYRFIVSIFGDRYFGLLPSLLYSIKTTNPNAQVSVFWEEMANERLSLVQKAFPEFEFVETDFKFSTNSTNRIASKTLVWEYAARIKMNEREEERLVFVDADMLVTQDLSVLLEQNDVDLIFTSKDEIYPINTGVMVLKNNTKAHALFELWKETTENILSDPALLAQATTRAYPYGAPDQMAFYKIVNFDHQKGNYSIQAGHERVAVKSLPCKTLNETNSTHITHETHIIHYKGGWQLILVDGYSFTKYRTKKESWEMYIYYLQTFLKAVSFINEKNQTHFEPSFFGIEIPFYLNTKTWQEKPLLYSVYSTISFIRQASKALKKRLQIK